MSCIFVPFIVLVFLHQPRINLETKALYILALNSEGGPGLPCLRTQHVCMPRTHLCFIQCAAERTLILMSQYSLMAASQTR